jgi:hypothetical protein
LIFGRYFPADKYINNNADRVNPITNLYNLDAIKQIIKNYISFRGEDDRMHFDNKNDLSKAEMRLRCKLNSVNETFVTIELPFKVEPATKINVSFLGESYLTVLNCEANNTGFTTECQLDNFSEMEINRIRQVLNKMNYLASKDIDLNKFESIDQVMDYVISENDEEGGGGDSEGESQSA